MAQVSSTSSSSHTWFPLQFQLQNMRSILESPESIVSYSHPPAAKTFAHFQVILPFLLRYHRASNKSSAIVYFPSPVLYSLPSSENDYLQTFCQSLEKFKSEDDAYSEACKVSSTKEQSCFVLMNRLVTNQPSFTLSVPVGLLTHQVTNNVIIAIGMLVILLYLFCY